MARPGGIMVLFPSMRRTDRLVELSRRDFCALAGCAALAIVGCTDGDAGVVQTGALGDTPDAPDHPGDPDAKPGSPDAHLYDAKPGSPDAAPSTGPACTGTATDCGAASVFVAGSPKIFSSGRFFVVRDSGGLYAVSSICTHEGATNGISSGHFRCPRHGATFTFNGDILGGPVSRGLVHYAMCIMSGGNVGVMTSQQVASTTRLVA